MISPKYILKKRTDAGEEEIMDSFVWALSAVRALYLFERSRKMLGETDHKYVLEAL